MVTAAEQKLQERYEKRRLQVILRLSRSAKKVMEPEVTEYCCLFLRTRRKLPRQLLQVRQVGLQSSARTLPPQACVLCACCLLSVY